MHLKWHEPYYLQQCSLSNTLVFWLTRPQNLAKALAKHCHQLTLKLLSMDYGRPQIDERDYLKPYHQSARFIIREIHLLGDDVIFTYARTIIPESTYLAYQSTFDTLKEQPIGKTLLYGHDKVYRSVFQFCFIKPKQWHKNPYLEQSVTPRQAQLAARRSLFFIEQHPLLISEIYFPIVERLNFE